MTKLLWDQVGERSYESGVDRGVLYLPDGSAIPWNGLTSVLEDFSEDTSTQYFLDGVSYLDSQSIGDFAGTIQAITYPDELIEFEGIEQVTTAVLADDQSSKSFSMSYRTLIGNDVGGSDSAYKIHIIYNITAIQDTSSHVSVQEVITPMQFSWKITTVPEEVPGYRPTAHLIIDSRYTNPYLLASLESMLYGDDNTDALLPSLSDLVYYVAEWDLIEIRDNLDGTWTATGPDEFVVMLDDTTFQIFGVKATWLDENTYKIATTQFVEDGGTDA